MTQEELMPTQVLYPEGVWDRPGRPPAHIEWATGIVQYFIPMAEHHRIRDADRAELTEAELYKLEVVTHEVTHLLQFVLTGYAYRLSWSLMAVTVQFASRFPSLTHQYDNLKPYASEVRGLLADLDVQGPSGVTARQILEGSAYLAQKRTHYKGLTADGFDRVLARQVADPAYRNAYEVARSLLFEDAYNQFPMIANLSLMTSTPGYAFKPLVELFAKSATRFDLVANFELGWDFLTDQFGDSLLGFAAHQSRGGRIHPVLRGGVERLAWLGENEVVDLRTLIGSGTVESHELARLLVGPSIYPPEQGENAPMWVPAHWASPQVEDVILDPAVLRLMAATSLLLQQPEPTDD